jgi:hypothetical protein
MLVPEALEGLGVILDRSNAVLVRHLVSGSDPNGTP